MKYSVNPPPYFADQDMQTLANYVSDELQRIAAQNDYTEITRLNLTKFNSVPAKPRDGDLAYADGTNWNPGYGQGVYRFDGTNWKPLMSDDYWLQHALDVISSTYGDTVSVVEKSKDLVKFGRTDMPGTGAKTTVEVRHASSSLNEVYETTNAIDYIVSDNAGDTETVVLEGHTVDGSGNFTFVSQSVTLTGQTPVQLSTSGGTALARATRIYNNDSTELQGNIYVYDSATTMSSGSPTGGYDGIHMRVRAGSQNSEKCSTTLSSQDYWIVTGVYADVLSVKSEDAIFALEVRAKGKVFREYFEFSAGSGSGAFRTGYPYIIIPPNSDVRVVAYDDGGVTGTMTVSAGIFGALAIVT